MHGVYADSELDQDLQTKYQLDNLFLIMLQTSTEFVRDVMEPTRFAIFWRRELCVIQNSAKGFGEGAGSSISVSSKILNC